MKTLIIVILMLVSFTSFSQSKSKKEERKYRRYVYGNAVTYDRSGTHYTVFRRGSAVTYSVPNRTRTRSYTSPNVSYTIIRK